MAFHLVDMATWPRAEQYAFTMQYMRCVHSVTTNVDIGHCKAELKKRGLKLTPALTYIVSRAANAHREFRYAVDDQGRLGYFDCVNPWYPLFHPETENLSFLWTDYQPDFSAFYAAYQRDTQAFENDPRFLPKGSMPPNVFPVSVEKWFTFSSFHLNVYQLGTQSCGRFHTLSCTFAKYFEQDGKLLIPMTLEMHHSVCDAFHCGRLIAEVQQMCDHCEEWLNETPA